jgi:Flp pilus assembly protein TadB
MEEMENREAKNWNSFFLGVVIALLPWLGLPLLIKNIGLTLAGILVILFSLARLTKRQKLANEF